MTPESPCARAFIASPSHDARAGGIDILLLHYTGMADAAAAQARLCDPTAKVSCHYLVFESGDTVQLVAEARRAWHAGAAIWQGTTDINSRAIGIEIANGGHDFGCPDYPPAQIEAVIRLCRDILARHAIPPHNVLAHSDVAPRRKRDPGETFPWRALHDAGIGLWVAPAPVTSGRMLAPGDRGAEVARLKGALRDYGYGIENAADIFDDELQDVVAAFQRHFRPQRVDGRADPSTVRTLHDLLAAKRHAERASSAS
jgi:N-acetylmuramoyl-L-alanine amidase